MLIEASSFRLCIDLIQSLEDSGFIASDIRLHYKGSKRFFEDKKSSSRSIRYTNLRDLKSTYLVKYNQISNTGKNGFTVNKDNSFDYNSKSYTSGSMSIPFPIMDIGSDSVDNIFKLGRYSIIRGVRLINKKLGFDASYNCINIHKDTFKIVKNVQFKNKRKAQRIVSTEKLENNIHSVVKKYKLINDKFFNLYLRNKNTNLEYIDPAFYGPDGKEYLLYKMHLPLIKRPLNDGLGLKILNPLHLIKQEVAAAPLPAPIGVTTTTVQGVTTTTTVTVTGGVKVTTSTNSNGCTTIS